MGADSDRSDTSDSSDLSDSPIKFSQFPNFLRNFAPLTYPEIAMKITEAKYQSAHGEITVAEITNASGASVRLSNLGAGIVSITVPDALGALRNVTLQYKNPADYFADGPCLGKTPGRFANRIALGKFTLDGVDYQLACNNGPNHLHGGPTGFQNQIWETETVGDSSVRFTLTSPAGHEGYPGTLKAAVTYTWSDDNALAIHY